MLENWRNQEPENKNLEELSILINQYREKIKELEDRLAKLE